MCLLSHGVSKEESMVISDSVYEIQCLKINTFVTYWKCSSVSPQKPQIMSVERPTFGIILRTFSTKEKYDYRVWLRRIRSNMKLLPL